VVEELPPVDGSAAVGVHGVEVGDLLLLNDRRQLMAVVLQSVGSVAELQILVQRDGRIYNVQPSLATIMSNGENSEQVYILVYVFFQCQLVVAGQ